MKLKVLIACEESQEVCKAFRELGHEAYSCDILDCSGGHPEWHIQGDVLDIIGDGDKTIQLQNRESIYVQSWDLIIAHPPCTYLSTAGIRWFNIERYGEKAILRHKLKEEAKDFVLKIANAKCDRIVIENPRGFLSKMWRKPNQIIQPWQFGDSFNKPTCLWIKGLPNLIPTNIVDKGEMVTHLTKKGKLKTDSKWYYEAVSLPPAERQKFRSKTFPGIAKAMAEQWSKYILEEKDEIFGDFEK
jgi:site-specific DNA-cytosine methylase